MLIKILLLHGYFPWFLFLHWRSCPEASVGPVQFGQRAAWSHNRPLRLPVAAPRISVDPKLQNASPTGPRACGRWRARMKTSNNTNPLRRKSYSNLPLIKTHSCRPTTPKRQLINSPMTLKWTRFFQSATLGAIRLGECWQTRSVRIK